MTIQNAIKSLFYTAVGHNTMTEQTHLCLLDPITGNPIGSDTIERAGALVNPLDDVVDMGLPSGTLWCKKNLGAVSETDNGWYFSWGNVDAHQKGAGYDFSQANYDASAAHSIVGNLTLAQDAARANKGAGWRMPSREEFDELFNSDYTEFVDANGNVIDATDKRTTYYGVKGVLLRSKANGNTIFFKCVGTYIGDSLQYEGVDGYYFTTSLHSNTINAYCLRIYVSGIAIGSGTRIRGFAIRPVR